MSSPDARTNGASSDATTSDIFFGDVRVPTAADVEALQRRPRRVLDAVIASELPAEPQRLPGPIEFVQLLRRMVVKLGLIEVRRLTEEAFGEAPVRCNSVMVMASMHRLCVQCALAIRPPWPCQCVCSCPGLHHVSRVGQYAIQNNTQYK